MGDLTKMKSSIKILEMWCYSYIRNAVILGFCIFYFSLIKETYTSLDRSAYTCWKKYFFKIIFKIIILVEHIIERLVCLKFRNLYILRKQDEICSAKHFFKTFTSIFSDTLIEPRIRESLEFLLGWNEQPDRREGPRKKDWDLKRNHGVSTPRNRRTSFRKNDSRIKCIEYFPFRVLIG